MSWLRATDAVNVDKIHRFDPDRNDRERRARGLGTNARLGGGAAPENIEAREPAPQMPD